MRQGRAVPALAILASLLVHAGFLAVASRLPRPPPAPAPPIELEVIERAPIPEAVPPPVAEAGPPVALAPAARRPPPVPREAAPLPARPPASGGRETVLREPGPLVPDLAPRLPAAGVAAPERPPPERPVAEGDGGLDRRVRDMITEEVPFRRAREAADPYWLGVKARLDAAFEVPAEVVEDRPGGGFGGQVRQGVRGYLAEAGRFGATGDPRTDLPEAHAPHGAAVPNIDAVLPGFDSSERHRIEPGDDATRLVTWVRASFAADGALERCAIERSSGVPAHDRLALEAVRALPVTGPRPADQADTIWAFETALWIVPPMPIAGCGLDATFLPTRCFYPMKRMVKSTVRLEALP